jgi:CRISPR-associated protein Csd2
VSYTDPAKRHDFVFLFDVTDGNPNGDPDAGNAPRADIETGHGLVTDVALKRKVRDFAAIHRGLPLFIQSDRALNRKIQKAFQDAGAQFPQIEIDDELQEWFADQESDDFDLVDDALVYTGDSVRRQAITNSLKQLLDDAEVGTDDPLRRKVLGLATAIERAGSGKQKVTERQREDAQQRLCREYFDIRMFGAVLSTGLNAGQVRGPVQIGFARSIDPIFQQPHSITRKAITRDIDRRRKETEMARKQTVTYGLYRAHGHVNPYFAERTGATAGDLEVLWEALANLFQYDTAAARAEMAVRGLYVFTHESRLGNQPAHKLFERIETPTARVNEPRRFADYRVTVHGEDLPPGVTLEPLVA